MRRNSLIVVSILVLAFLVRLPLINGSFWMDEAAQSLESMRPLNQQLYIETDFQPPLFHLIGYVMTRVSTVEWWLRMASVIPGIVTIGFTYAVGVKLGGKKQGMFVGIFAAVLLSLSAFHVYFSQEFRQYSLPVMWAAISWWVLIRKKDQAYTRRNLVVFALCTTAGLYTMYVYPFLLFSQLLYVGIHERGKLFQVVGATVAAAMLFLPWVPSFLRQLKIGTTLQYSLPGWAEVVSSPQWKAVPLVFLKFLGGVRTVDATRIDLLYFGGGALLVLFLMAVVIRQKEKLLPVWYWLIGSIGSAWLVSFVVPVVSPKRVLFALPAFYLLVAHSVSVLRTRLRKTAIILFLLIQCFGLWSYWSNPHWQREDWRTAVSNLHVKFSSQTTVVVFGFTEPFASWKYYELRYSQQYATIAFPKMPIGTVENIDIAMQPAMNYQTVLVLDYLRDLTDPQRSIERWLEMHGYTGVASIDTQNVGFIRQYEKL